MNSNIEPLMAGFFRRAFETAGQGDIVVLGVQAAERHMPSIFTRTAEALLRRPPCEVLIDSMPV